MTDYQGEYNGIHKEGSVVPWWPNCVFGCDVEVTTYHGTMTVTQLTPLWNGNGMVTRADLYCRPGAWFNR